MMKEYGDCFDDDEGDAHVNVSLTYSFGPPQLLVDVEHEGDVCIARLGLAKARRLHEAIGRLIARMEGTP
jgi:hypothetical protein